MTFLYIGLSVHAIILFFSLLYIVHYKLYQKRQSYVLQFEQYIGVLTFHLEKAFDVVYKDRILVYSVEGTRPSDSEFQNHSKDFCRLVLRLLGPTLEEEFNFLYGEDTLLLTIAEYFNSRSENDEIRQASLDQIMDTDIDIE